MFFTKSPSKSLFALAMTLFMATSFALSAQAQYLQPLDVRQVKVGGEIGRRLDVTINNNFMVIDVDKEYLAPFQRKNAQEGYIGLGKFIDSAVKFAAYTGDDKVLARKKHLVDTAIAAQEADGYLGILPPQLRMKTPWDVHEMGYLIFGLTSDWHYFQERKSLEAARKIADYLLAHWKEIPDDWDKQIGISTNLTTTGLDRAMIALASETGEKKYLEFCIHERQLLKWNKDIEIGRRPGIEGHVYAFLSRCLALQELAWLPPTGSLQLEQLRNPDFPPTTALPQPSGSGPNPNQPHRAWDFLINHGLTITGACGQWECWHDDQDGRGALGETCATAYQLRFLEHAQRSGAWVSNFGDLIERTIYNALFAAQSPDGRKIRYYTPFEGRREYFSTDTFCCPGNFRRIIAELPEMIYYRSELPGNRKIVVNLYTPSTATIRLPAESNPPKVETPPGADAALTPIPENASTIKLRQETDYPNSGKITLFVDPDKPTEFELDLRIPHWCKKPNIKFNGNPLPSDDGMMGGLESGNYCMLHRKWKAGDRIELELPMKWRFVLGRERQAGRVAVMRGPVLFCLNPLRQENAQFKDWDAADIGQCVLVPETIAGPAPDNSVRPNGMSCRIKGFKPGCNCTEPDAEFQLAEFPDPDGRAVYFRLRDFSDGTEDELLHSGLQERTTPGF